MTARRFIIKSIEGSIRIKRFLLTSYLKLYGVFNPYNIVGICLQLLFF